LGIAFDIRALEIEPPVAAEFWQTIFKVFEKLCKLAILSSISCRVSNSSSVYPHSASFGLSFMFSTTFITHSWRPLVVRSIASAIASKTAEEGTFN